jgi:outer membrane receptor protein involved in Fe transport
VNFWTSKDLSKGFGLGGGGRYVSGQFIAPDNGFKISDYLTLEAAAYYQRENWKFSLNFKNLTNRKYETRGFGNTSVIPADPFAVYARIDFTLGN